MAGEISDLDLEFEVEARLDARKFFCEEGKLRVWYLVKLKNCPNSDNRWLPASYCNCRALVRQYFRKKRERELGTNEDPMAPSSPSDPSLSTPMPSSPSTSTPPPPSPSPSSPSSTSAIPIPDEKRKKKKKKSNKKRVRHMDKLVKFRICYNCQQKGHMANTCTNDRQRPQKKKKKN